MKEVVNPQKLPMGTLFHLDTRGSSMQGFISPGDILLAQRVDPKDLSIGDIVVYKSERYQEHFTHRLIYKKKKDGKILYIFKGDALISFDEPVSGESILGKILVIEKGDLCIELNSVKGRLQSWLFFFSSMCDFFLKTLLRLSPFGGRMKKYLQSFVLKTRRNRILNYVYRAYYHLAIKFFKLIFSSFSQIESIYLRRQMAKGNWQAGSSDIDLSVIIKEMPPDEEEYFLKTFWKSYHFLKKIFPVLGEVEISTRMELQNWQRISGFRAQEVLYWRSIYSQANVPHPEPTIGRTSESLNYLSEAMQSFWILSLSVSGKREKDVYPHEFRKFFNLVADILKFIEKIARDDVADERQKFIVSFIAQHNNSEFGQELMQFIDKIVNNASKIESVLLINIYSHIVNYLDRSCALVYKKLFSYKNENLDDYFSVKHLVEKVDADRDTYNILWKENVAKFAKLCENNLTSILSNSHVFTNHSFIVLKDSLNIDDIKETCRKAFTTLLNKELAIVTKNILQCISCSLFMESPFNYWNLVEQARVDFGVDPKRYLKKPPDYIIFSLFNKSIGQFNIYFRRFPINRVPTYLIHHSIDHIMRLRLALEKRIIVSSLKEAISEYKAHFKSDGNTKALGQLEKYLTFTGGSLDRFSNQYIFYEQFRFIRGEMAKLNDIIAESITKDTFQAPLNSLIKTSKQIKTTNVKCIKPWTSLFLKNNEIRTCCWSKLILLKLHAGISISDFWNKDVAQYLRQKMLEGRTWDICQEFCPVLNLGSDTFTNYEKKRNKFSDNELKIYNHIKDGDIKIDSRPFKLDVVMDHVCNLKCKMCFRHDNPDYVVSKGFYNIVDEIHDSLQVLYLIGGEPFVSKRTRAFIHDCLRKKYNFKFEFVTNGTIFDRELLSKIGLYGFCFSIDGATRETYEKIRRGANFEKVMGNLKALIKFRDEHPDSFYIRVAFLVMTSNFREIPKAIELFEPLGVCLEFPPIIQIPADPENIFEKEEYYDEFMKVIEEAKKKTSQDMVLNSLNVLKEILDSNFIEGRCIGRL